MEKYINALKDIKNYLQDRIELEKDILFDREQAKIDVEALEIAIKLLMQEPCEDAISRQAVLDLVNSDWKYEGLETDVASLPPVTPQPKTEHWVEENIDKWGRKISCSECGCPPPFEYVSDGDVYSANGYGVINKTKFCPNCGAKMIELQKSER